MKPIGKIAMWLILMCISIYTSAQTYTYPSSAILPSLQNAEYFFDTLTAPGSGVMVPISNTYDLQNLSQSINTDSLSPGIHKLYIRTQDNNGAWSLTATQQLVVVPNLNYAATTTQASLTQVEYFFDTLTAPGSGVMVPISNTYDLQNLSQSINTDSLSPGIHKLYIRTQDNNGAWSLTATQQLVVVPNLNYAATTTQASLTQVEYFFDTLTAPGSGVVVPISTTYDLQNLSQSINTDNLSPGIHKLYIRTQDNNGAWSLTASEQLVVVPNLNYAANTTQAYLTHVEYFFDTLTAPGSGVVMPISTTYDLQNLSQSINTDNLSPGIHKLYIRTQDNNGAWSLIATQQLVVVPNLNYAATTTQAYLTQLEYFFDTLTAPGSGVVVPISNTYDLQNLSQSINTDNLSPGIHKLYIRTQNNNGAWSLTATQQIIVIPSLVYAGIAAQPNLVQGEYFFDSLIAHGAGTSFTLTSLSDIAGFVQSITTDTLSPGNHILYIRTQDNNGAWSLTATHNMNVMPGICNVSGALAGNYDIPSACFPTLDSFIKYVNLNGVNGHVVANMNMPETAPANGYELGSTVLNNSLNANQTLTINGHHQIITTPFGNKADSNHITTIKKFDVVFRVKGTSFVTFDSLDIRENAFNVSSGNFRTQFENAFRFSPFNAKLSNDITIQNCKIDFNGRLSNSSQELAIIVEPLPNATVADTLKNIIIRANTFDNFHSILDINLDPSHNLKNITIGGPDSTDGNLINKFGATNDTSISNFIHSSLIASYTTGINTPNFQFVANGAYVYADNQNCMIQHNIFNYLPVSHIFARPIASRFDVVSNTINGGTIDSVFISNTYFVNAEGKRCDSNTIQNFNINTSWSYFYAITRGGGLFGDSSVNTTNGNIILNITKKSGPFRGINIDEGNHQLNHNTISNINITVAPSDLVSYEANSYSSPFMTGIKFYNFNNNGLTFVAANNDISNMTISGSHASAGAVIYGLIGGGVKSNLINNSIRDLHINVDFALDNFIAATNLYTGGIDSIIMDRNNMNNLSIHSSSMLSNNTIYGIYNDGFSASNATDTARLMIKNNFISKLSANRKAKINGAYIAQIVNQKTKIKLLHNTINIGSDSILMADDGSKMDVSGIELFPATTNFNSTPSLKGNTQLLNNIVRVNAKPSSTGFVSAVRLFNHVTFPNNQFVIYDSQSNGNIFHAVPNISDSVYHFASFNANGVLVKGFNNTNDPNFNYTHGAFKQWMYTADQNTYTENDLMALPNHTYAPGLNSLAANSAILSNVSTDYNNNLRSATPDRGALEFAGISPDIVGPTISLITNASSYCAILPNLSATITDSSGINTLVGSKPKLYYKKYSEANQLLGNSSASNGWKYVEASNTTSPFTFDLDEAILYSPASLGDTIQYFIVAQDNSALANISFHNAILDSSVLLTSTTLPNTIFPITNTYSFTLSTTLSSMLTASNSTICTGNYTQLNAVITGGQNPINYSWMPAINLSDATIANPVASPMVSTVYTLTATDINGCATFTTISIATNNLPVVTATPDSIEICTGSIITLNGGGAVTYTWSNGVINNSPFVPSNSNTYTVTGTDNFGCTNTATAIVLLNATSNATTLSGTYDIPSSCFSTLASFVNQANVVGIAGPVTVNLHANETAPAGGYQLGSTILNNSLNSNHTLTFNGKGNTITAWMGIGAAGINDRPDAIFQVNGCDYITIDSFNLVENTANVNSGSAITQMEAGILARCLDTLDAPRHLTIQNCTVNLNGATSSQNEAGISVQALMKDENRRSNNVIFYPYQIMDSILNITIKNNVIHNAYSGVIAYCHSMFTDNILIENNTINNIGSNAPLDTQLNTSVTNSLAFGIGAVGGSLNNNLAIQNNTINYSSVYRNWNMGIWTQLYDVIGNTLNGGIDSSNAVQILGISANSAKRCDSNTIQNFTFVNTQQELRCINRISFLGEDLSTTIGNTIKNINLIEGCNFQGIYNRMEYAPTKGIISNNIISYIKVIPTAALYNTTKIVPIAFDGESDTLLVNDNTIDSINVAVSNADSTIVHGIYCANEGNVYINRGTVSNITISGSSNGSIVTGIEARFGKTQIQKCNVHDIVDSSTTILGQHNYGYWLANNASLENSFVSKIAAPFGNNDNAIVGIMVQAPLNATSTHTVNLLHNTVALGVEDALAGGYYFGVSGIAWESSTAQYLKLRNSISYINALFPSGGKASALRCVGATNNGYDLQSDYNVLYANENFPSYGYSFSLAELNNFSLVSFNTGNDCFNSSNSGYKNYIGADAHTFSENNLVALPNHEYAPVGSSAANDAALPGLAVDDYSNALRSATPDIGALEFAGTSLDIAGPTIVFTPVADIALCDSNSTIALPTIQAYITDISGVDIINKPRLYYKQNNEYNSYTGNTNFDDGWKYVEASNTTSPFSFTMDASLLYNSLEPGSTIEYFIVAQDNSSINNVSANTLSANSNSCLGGVDLSFNVYPIISTHQFSILATPQVLNITASAVLSGPCYDTINLSATIATSLGNYIPQSVLWTPSTNTFYPNNASLNVSTQDIFYGGKTFTVTVTDSSGCTHEQTVNAYRYGIAEVSLNYYCNSFIHNGVTYTSNQEFVDTFSAANGCDSLHFTNYYNQATYSYTFETTCDSFYFNGIPYFVNGVYTDTFTNAVGCDSFSVLYLNVPSTTINSIEYVCDSIVWHGNTYTESGIYPVIYTGANGCDSTHTLYLTVFKTSGSDTIVTNDSIYIWNGNTYTISGIYTDTFSNGWIGCDSVHTIYLTLNGNISASSSHISCDSLLLPGTSTYVYSSNTYIDTFNLVNGGDSVHTYYVTINHSSVGSSTVSACGSYVWNNTTYTASATPTYSYTNAAGCDSVHTLYLTIKSSSVGSSTVTACDAFVWNNTTYTASATPTFTYTNAAGCDSVHTLYLTIKNSSVGSSTVTACDTYAWNNTSYTASATPTFTYSNAAGCDSVHTLYLTIKNSSVGSSTVTACDTYAWNNTTYTASATPTFTYTNAAGCDSVHTLYLTIKNSSVGSSTVTACDTYIWNNTTYTASATPTYSYTNAAGCDSVHTLYLTINKSSIPSNILVNNVPSFIIPGTSTTIISNGTIPHTYSNAAGCDSVVNYIITIGNGNANMTYDTACNSYVWNGNTYTVSGIYVDTFTTAVNIDSVHTLVLTIHPTPAAPQVSVINSCTHAVLNASTSNAVIWSNGAATSSIMVTTTGTFAVQQLVNGCLSDSAIVTAEPINQGVVSTAGLVTPTCFGKTDGSFTAAVAKGAPPFSYTSSPVLPQLTVGNFINVSAGTYTISVSDNNGCVQSGTVVMSQPAVLNATAVLTYPSCNGLANGQITLQPIGGTANYSFSSTQNIPQSNPGTFVNLVSTIYVIRVTDANGCSKSIIVPLQQPAKVKIASVIKSNPLCNGATTGSLLINANGGIGVYSYQMNGGVINSNPLFASLAANTYTVTVKDNNACSATSIVSLTQPLVISWNNVQVVMPTLSNSNGAISVAAVGGVGTKSYSKDSVTFQNSGTFGSLLAGIYTISAKDGNQCKVTTTVQLLLPANQFIADDYKPRKEKDIITALWYPNPTSSVAYTNYSAPESGQIKLILYGLSGNELMLFEIPVDAGPNKITIDLSTLPSGLYFTKILLEDQVVQLGKVEKR